MTRSPDSNRVDDETRLFEEIDEALQEIELSEQAFQWAQNIPEAVDYAIRRREAAIKHYDFLINQVKKSGVKLTKDELIMKIIRDV